MRNLLSVALLKRIRKVAQLCRFFHDDPRMPSEELPKMAECAFQMFLSFEISLVVNGECSSAMY